MAALHDLAMASRFVDRVYLMKDGRFIADGATEDVVTQQNIKKAYDVDASVYANDAGILQIDYQCPDIRYQCAI